MPELDSLWSPLEIGGTTVKNRVMTSAHSLAYGDNHILSDRHIDYYEERAAGGIGLLITEQHAAHRLSLGSFYNCLTAWEERCIPQMEKLAETVHAHGCKQFVQLMATGVQDKGWLFDPWHPLWAVSRVPSPIHNEVPYVMGQPEIDDIIAGHVESARNVERSGLDGIELHGAHSYLIGQFLSPFYNQRTDRYGGSVKQRCQFAIELGTAIRDVTGPTFTVGMRLSFDELIGDAGITPEQTEEQLDVLAETGLFDFFDISGGSYHTLSTTVAPMGNPDGIFVDDSKRAKGVVGDRAKVFVVGRIRDLELAASVISDEAADMVCMTRAHITDPQVVKKALEGRGHETKKCVGANECLLRNFQQRDIFCLVNPVTGREGRWGGSLPQVAPGEAKRVAVVGGGPAGMKAAEIAAKRGHDVTLLEREAELGGHINLLKQLPTRADWQDAIDGMTVGMDVGGVDVQLGVDATSESLGELAPNAVIYATGATWDCTGFTSFRYDRQALPGVEQENVLDVGTATTLALENPESLGERVIIVDETGDYLPLGLAEVLGNAGTSVEVVTWRLFVGENVHGAFEAAHVLPRLANVGVTLTAQAFIEKVEANEVELYDTWGGWRRTEQVDTVVVSLLRTPREQLYEETHCDHAETHRIGDALAPRRTIVSIYEGEEVGRRL